MIKIQPIFSIYSDLGIVINDFTEVFIDAYTYLPIKQSRSYAVLVDDSNKISCKIFERESEKSKNNNFLGSFDFKTCSSIRKGIVKLDISFEVDDFGILTVTVKEQNIDNEISVTFGHAIKTSGNSKSRKNNIGFNVLGIDLGTSYSIASIYKDGKTIIVPPSECTHISEMAFLNYVAVTDDGEILVGESARKQAIKNPQNTVSAIKRRMGSDYRISLQGKEFTPQEIAAKILEKIKKDAESFLGEPIEKAIITVPAYFDDNQRTATKDAGALAGLDVIRLVSEPVAACIAYGIDKIQEEDVNILVFDLGGGTLDVTIIEFDNGIFEVLSTSEDPYLGSIDMDNLLIKYLADEFEKEHGIDLLSDSETERRLREAAEKAKIELSIYYETEINIPFIALSFDGKPLNLLTTLNQSQFKLLIKPILDQCGRIIDKALEGALLTPDEIDKIIMVGKATRMPIVQNYIEDFTGKKIERGIDPEECVAQGAAILGSKIMIV